MERISENDVDCFLQQMAQVFAPLPEMGKCREEWRHLPGFRIWLPGSFQLADRETAEEVFWSEALPEMLYMTEDGTAGITLQTMEDAEVTVQEVRQRLERLDERIVCYGSGTEEGRAGVRWLGIQELCGGRQGIQRAVPLQGRRLRQAWHFLLPLRGIWRMETGGMGDHADDRGGERS